jgi:Ca2+/H+ antiporter
MDLRPIYGWIIVLIGFGLGVAVRLGAWRSFEQFYRDEASPAVFRNLWFALIPICASMTIGLVAAQSVSESAPRILSEVLFFLMPITFLAALGVALRPPEMLKPKWLVEKERSQSERRPRLHGYDLVVATVLGGVGIVAVVSTTYLLIRG